MVDSEYDQWTVPVMGSSPSFDDCAHCNWPVVIQRYKLSGNGHTAEAECASCGHIVVVHGTEELADLLLRRWNEHMRLVRMVHALPTPN